MAPRKKTTARKTVARKTPAKQPAAKKTTAKAPKPSSVFNLRPAVLERYEDQGAAVLKATGGDPDKIESVGKKMKMSFGKARRLFTLAQRKQSEKLFLQDLTPNQVGKELIRLRDVEGRIWDPDLWSRMLTTQDTAIVLYTDAGGKDWTGRGGARGTTEEKPKAAKKTTAKATARKAPAKRVGRSKRVRAA